MITRERMNLKINSFLRACQNLSSFLKVIIILGMGLFGMSLTGCYRIRKSSGGGQTSFTPPRIINTNDIALPDRYLIELVAKGLTFPTGVTFDEKGRIYVVESGYAYGEVWTTPRLLRVEPDGNITLIAEGEKNGPWTGVTFHKGAFYVAEGGEMEGGRILHITPDGKITALVEGLPSQGTHHTNGPVVGPDGWLYFGQGTVTNSGVVGEDGIRIGWLKRYPDLHDLPCRDIALSGQNFVTENYLDPNSSEKISTGAFSPFGERTKRGQIIKGCLPCNGAVMRIQPEGGTLELVAWGLRNPFGLSFSPDGRLFVTENQYDTTGSRPIFGAGDLLREVEQGQWYGWPDFHGNNPLNEEDRYQPQGQTTPEFLLAEHPGTPPKPVAIFAVHSSSNGFDFSRNKAFGFIGQAFVAQFGDEAPSTGKVISPAGFKVVRVDISTGIIEEFVVNKGKTNGPASWLGKGGLERPIAARFNQDGSELYLVDFGVMLEGKEVTRPQKETGVLWRIKRTKTISTLQDDSHETNP